MLAGMTHEDLRKRAVKWLTNTVGCSVVLSEIVTCATQEIPDAIGFHGGKSVMVECKVSRGDFFANAKKAHVIANTGVGQMRYFMVPDGLVTADEVPAGYGLLVVSSGKSSRVHVAKPAERNEDANILAERGMLVSALRRVRTREFLVIAPADPVDANDSL